MGDREFHARLGQVVKQFGSVAELARAVSVSDNAIYKWRAGRGEPTIGNLVAIAHACRVSLEWLATGRETRDARRGGAGAAERGEYVFVPRYDVRVSAGRAATFRSDQVVDYLAFKAEWVHRQLGADPRNLLLVEAVGDSMAPTFEDSDLLLVDLGEPRFRQDGIYVIRREADLAVKRLQRRADGRIVIRSDNPAYEPQVVSSRTVGIIGRVIWAAGRL